MALKRVTIQDIADACKLSRNTVSKVFNDRGAVPEATKRAVMQKAQELGYGSFSKALNAQVPTDRGLVAVLTQQKLLSHHFGASFMTSFADQLSRLGHTMKVYEVTDEEVALRKLPPHLLLEQTAAVLTIELFDKDYLDMIGSLGLPCVVVDGHARMVRSVLKCDFLSMENFAASTALTQRVIDAGAKTIGFVGDKEHCSSFYMRWLACHTAVTEAKLQPPEAYSILESDDEPYGEPDWLNARIDRMPRVPDAFVCANDYIAIHLLAALKRRGLSVPDDVMVTGFDGPPESTVLEPPLTTAQIPSSDIGRFAATLLIQRFEAPAEPYRVIYYKTTPIFRGTTR